MSWKAIDRNRVDPHHAGPGLSDAAKDKIRAFFPRYATKRAVTLPALHVAQDEIGYVSLTAMREIADLLEIPPAAVMDVVTFYTHFWTHPKGRKTIVVCRSLTCQLMGQPALQAELQKQLASRGASGNGNSSSPPLAEHDTSPDGEYSLMTEECLAACNHAPCLMVNEKMHKRVRPEDVARILADPNNDRLDVPRSDLFDAPPK